MFSWNRLHLLLFSSYCSLYEELWHLFSFQNVSDKSKTFHFQLQIENLSDEVFSLRHKKYEEKEQARWSLWEQSKWHRRNSRQVLHYIQATYLSFVSYSTLFLMLIVSISNRFKWANNVKILHKKVISVYYNGGPNTSDYTLSNL